jgi:hypothetical protein
MRSILVLVLSAMLSSFLLACGGDAPAPPNAPSGTSGGLGDGGAPGVPEPGK